MKYISLIYEIKTIFKLNKLVYLHNINFVDFARQMHKQINLIKRAVKSDLTSNVRYPAKLFDHLR